MTGAPVMQPLLESDRDHLEFMLYLTLEMKKHGQAWFARKMPGDEKLYNEAKERLNNFIRVLKKRGYNYDRFTQPHQQSLNL